MLSNCPKLESQTKAKKALMAGGEGRAAGIEAGY
jgi:hypothetical protein